MSKYFISNSHKSETIISTSDIIQNKNKKAIKKKKNDINKLNIRRQINQKEKNGCLL